jgi:hypothetical protein
MGRPISELKDAPEIRVLYAVARWHNDRVVRCSVLKETAKQLVIRQGGSYVSQIRADELGVTYFETPLQAFQGRAAKLINEIAVAKQKLNEKRTDLGMVESKIRDLQRASA